MAIAYSTPRAIYLRCALRVGVWDGDTPPTSYSDPVNFTKAEISNPTQEAEQLISNMIASYGSAIDSQQKPTEPASIALEFNTLTPRLIAVALGADLSEVTQSSGDVTAEAVTTQLNAWVPLANRYITAHGTGTEIVLKTSPGGVTVDSSKYELDLTLGLIKAIHADAVGAMTIDYTKAARTYEKYEGGQAKTAYVKLWGEAYDAVSQKSGILVVHKANLAADGAFDPVVGGYLAGSLSGDLIAPTGTNSPVEWHLVTA